MPDNEPMNMPRYFAAPRMIKSFHWGILGDIPLSRMKLFDAVVTPSALYACAIWTLTGDLERQLRSTRRQMLRKMFRVGRRVDEEWPDYVRRATHTCKDLATIAAAQIGFLCSASGNSSSPENAPRDWTGDGHADCCPGVHGFGACHVGMLAIP